METSTHNKEASAVTAWEVEQGTTVVVVRVALRVSVSAWRVSVGVWGANRAWGASREEDTTTTRRIAVCL